MTSYTVIDTKLAMELRRLGLSWSEVAEQCGASAYLVRKALRRAGLKYWGRYQEAPPLMTQYQVKRMKRLKAAGATWKELSKITGLEHRRLERYVNSH